MSSFIIFFAYPLINFQHILSKSNYVPSKSTVKLRYKKRTQFIYRLKIFLPISSILGAPFQKNKNNYRFFNTHMKWHPTKQSSNYKQDRD